MESKTCQTRLTWVCKGLASHENQCLVGGLEHAFYFSIYWECHHPNWLSYFFRGVGLTTNQMFIHLYYVSPFVPKSCKFIQVPVFFFGFYYHQPATWLFPCSLRCVAEPTIWAREVCPGSIKESVALRGLGAFCGFRILSIFIGGVMPHFLTWGYPQISSLRRFCAVMIERHFDVLFFFLMG